MVEKAAVILARLEEQVSNIKDDIDGHKDEIKDIETCLGALKAKIQQLDASIAWYRGVIATVIFIGTALGTVIGNWDKIEKVLHFIGIK